MLDRLPVELIDRVLLALVPPVYRLENTTFPRFKALEPCLLVSRAIRSRALPIVWREASLDRLEDYQRDPLQEFLEWGSSEAVRLHVASIVFGATATNSTSLSRAALTSLRLAQLGLWPPESRDIWPPPWPPQSPKINPFPIFHSLVCLTLDCISGPDAPSLFSPAYFPSLRVLLYIRWDKSRFVSADEPPPDDLLSPSPSFLSLLDQLDVLQLEGLEEHPVPDANLAFAGFMQEGLEHVPSLLEFTPHLISLHLPSFLSPKAAAAAAAHPTSPSFPTSFPAEPFQAVVQAILSCSVKRGVEVCWHTDDEEDNEEISPSFWRFAKEFKAREAL
ncbi:hypothetical protein JCM6882_004954 [Rhodosporidiobolus microsporus]